MYSDASFDKETKSLYLNESIYDFIIKLLKGPN
jgi:hypothetical protein